MNVLEEVGLIPASVLLQTAADLRPENGRRHWWDAEALQVRS